MESRAAFPVPRALLLGDQCERERKHRSWAADFQLPFWISEGPGGVRHLRGGQGVCSLAGSLWSWMGVFEDICLDSFSHHYPLGGKLMRTFQIMMQEGFPGLYMENTSLESVVGEKSTLLPVSVQNHLA